MDVLCCFAWLVNMISSIMSSVHLQLVTYYNWFFLRLLIAIITTMFSLGSASRAYSHWKGDMQIFRQYPRLARIWKLPIIEADISLH